MKVRWTSLGVAIGLAVGVTAGFAIASDASTPGADDVGSAAITQTDGSAVMEAMHDSPAMQRVHSQMPEELREQCEAMHEEMEQMMGAGGMMGGGMGAHHPGTSGGGMMGSGSDGPGGMMGSSSSGMMGG